MSPVFALSIPTRLAPSDSIACIAAVLISVSQLLTVPPIIPVGSNRATGVKLHIHEKQMDEGRTQLGHRPCLTYWRYAPAPARDNIMMTIRRPKCLRNQKLAAHSHGDASARSISTRRSPFAPLSARISIER